MTGLLSAIAGQSSFSSSSSFSSIMQLIGGVLVFVLIFVAARYVTKYLARSRNLTGRGGNLDVLESRAVGVGSSISIVRAGDKYFLVGVTKERVEFLAELNADGLEFQKQGPVSFQNVMTRFLNRGRGENAEKDGEKADE